MKKGTWTAALLYVVYLGLVILGGRSLGYDGWRLAIFCTALGAVGAMALAIALNYARTSSGVERIPAANASDASDLDTLVRSAATSLNAARNNVSTHTATPVLYVIGDENSAKTQTVLQSGLDAELLSGTAYAGDMVAPTRLANIWFAASAVVVEAGGALLRQPGLLQRLAQLTQSNHLQAAHTHGERQSARAVVVCVSMERIASANSSDGVRALGLLLNERLRLLSHTLGVSLPVYVLFTKLDAVPSFAEFVANLTDEEAMQPMGAFLPWLDAQAEHERENVRSTVAERVDELCYWLTKFRV